MNESILTSIKKLLGITEEYEVFDSDLIMHINTVFSVLNQLGVGPTNGFFIEDKSAVWSSFVGTDAKMTMVKSYIGIKVRLLFDPPSSSAVIEVLKLQAAELESRLMIAAEQY